MVERMLRVRCRGVFEWGGYAQPLPPRAGLAKEAGLLKQCVTGDLVTLARSYYLSDPGSFTRQARTKNQLLQLLEGCRARGAQLVNHDRSRRASEF